MRKVLLYGVVAWFLIFPAVSNAGDRVVVVPLGKSSSAVSRLSTTLRSNTSSGNPSNYIGSQIVISSCYPDEILVGGACSSDAAGYASATTNYGVVWKCGIVGNSILGMAMATDITMSIAKYGPPMTVHAICAADSASAKGHVRKEGGVSSEVLKLKMEMQKSLAELLSEYNGAH